MPRRTLVLAAILLLSMCSVPPISAQDSPLPGIEITCVNEETTLYLDYIGMGDYYALAICTIENPSSFNEDIEIDYDGEGLSVTGPESLSLAAGAEETIEISVFSNSAESVVYNMTVSVQVTSVQGSPDLADFLQVFLPSDETNIVAQVAEFVDLRVTSQPSSLILSSELMQPMSASVIVTNDGNVDDDVTVTVISTILNERDIGWNITSTGDGNTIDSGGGSETYTIRFNPNPDMQDESFSIIIRVESSVDNSKSVDVTLTINTTAPEESVLDLTALNVPSWAYAAAGTLALLFVLAIARSLTKRVNKASKSYLDELDGIEEDFEDEDEDFEEDFELEDLDDDLDDLDDELDDLDDFEF